jgi:ethanolamine utilization cobalamin adenosyltransferase
MRVITESLLRSEFKKGIPEKYIIKKDFIITPSARQFLRDKQVETVYEHDEIKIKKIEEAQCLKTENEYGEFKEIKLEYKPKFISDYDGGMYEKKPEYMTHIHGNKLVFKDDDRIVFRGKIDSLQAKLQKVQIHLSKHGEEKFSSELEDVLVLLRNILKAEVLEEDLGEHKLFGLALDEIQRQSHDPKKYYGISHFLPSVDMGIAMVELNVLRAEIRELELHAMKAFRNGVGVNRKDIIRSLNRASSGLYVLMCRCKSQYYENNKR